MPYNVHVYNVILSRALIFHCAIYIRELFIITRYIPSRGKKSNAAVYISMSLVKYNVYIYTGDKFLFRT